MHFSILMENRLAVQLGKYSYAIYMIHYFIAMRFDEIYRYLPSGSVVEIALFLFTVALLGWLPDWSISTSSGPCGIILEIDGRIE